MKTSIDFVEDEIRDFVGQYGVVKGTTGYDFEIKLNYPRAELCALVSRLAAILIPDWAERAP